MNASASGVLPLIALCDTVIAEPPYFMGVGNLPGEYGASTAAGVSDDGLTVVGSTTIHYEPLVERAFRWTEAGGMVGLGELPGGPERGNALALSADGSVVVGDSYYQQYLVAPFRWTADAGMASLGFLPGGNHASALGVSSDGSLVVGWSDSYQGIQAFLHDADGSMMALGALDGQESTASAISDGGSIIVGQSWATEGFHARAIVWTDGGKLMTPLPGLPGTAEDGGASDCSADGSVIAGFVGGPQGNRACLWVFDDQTWSMEVLGELPGEPNTQALAVSRDGSIAVGMIGSLDGMFIWDARRGIRDLKTMLVEDYALTVLQAWTNTEATGVSGDGRTFVGYGYNQFGQREGWVAYLGPPCYPDFTGDGALDLFDFLAFVNAFNAGDPAADGDGNGVLDLFDFLYFVNAFNKGC